MLGKTINSFVNASVYKHISSLESRVDELEMENVNTTNALYELENRIQSKLDKIQPVVYNIVNKDKDV